MLIQLTVSYAGSLRPTLLLQLPHPRCAAPILRARRVSGQCAETALTFSSQHTHQRVRCAGHNRRDRPSAAKKEGFVAISGGNGLWRPVARRRDRLAPDSVHGRENASRRAYGRHPSRATGSRWRARRRRRRSARLVDTNRANGASFGLLWQVMGQI